MKRRRLIVDWDNIVVDLPATALEIYNGLRSAEFPETTKADISKYNLIEVLHDKLAAKLMLEKFDSYDIWPRMQLLHPSVASYLEIWNEMFDLRLVTHARTGLAMAGKHDWLDKMLPWVKWNQVGMLTDKFLIGADMIIDDKPRTLWDYAEHWPTAILATVRYPYHDDPGDPTPVGTFLADSYANPERAWSLLHQYVTERLG